MKKLVGDIWWLGTIVLFIVTLGLLGMCAIDTAYGDTSLRGIMDKVTTKLETFQRDGDFSIFYDIEANKSIIGLESEQDIARFREDEMHLWCFVPAQILRNYLVAAGARTVRIMVLRGSEKIKPFDWDYHIVVVVVAPRREIRSFYTMVLDPVLNVMEWSDIYLKRFENTDLTAKILTDTELREFLQPTEMFKPKSRFPGIKPNYGREIGFMSERIPDERFYLSPFFYIDRFQNDHQYVDFIIVCLEGEECEVYAVRLHIDNPPQNHYWKGRKEVERKEWFEYMEWLCRGHQEACKARGLIQ